MPVKPCQKDSKPGFKFGDEGTCYTYDPDSERSRKTAREKAATQGAAIKIAEEGKK